LPGASMAYYGMARTITVPGTHVVRAAGKAALLYRVALDVSPQNVLAGNELGVLLAQHGQLNEAERMFQYCIATKPSPQAYQNLAAIYGRRGDERSRQAMSAAGEALAVHERGVVQGATQAGLQNTTNGSYETEPNTQKPSYLAKLPAIPQLSGMFRK
jgi:tetratricopeptide (TPR) repeat protein